MDVHGVSASAGSIHHLIRIRDLQDPIKPYPFREELRVSIQRRSHDPDKVARLIRIWASGCRCRSHSSMDFLKPFLDPTHVDRRVLLCFSRIGACY